MGYFNPRVDCVACGCCCFSESPRHARVTGDAYERLEDETLVEGLGNEAFMRLARTGGVSHCAALEVRREPAGTRYSCTIYERRPQVCRDLERGSSACEGERHAKGPRLVVLHSS